MADRSPLLLVHGITASARAWDSTRPYLEDDYELIVPGLVGHCGGPPLPDDPSVRPIDALVDGLERAIDDAGHDTVHVLGNSLGGYLSFELAARGRARSVVALSPGQGWEGDTVPRSIERFFRRSARAAPHTARLARWIAVRPGTRRLALRAVVAHPERLSPAAAAEMIESPAECTMLDRFIEAAAAGDFRSDLRGIDVPVTIAWGERDVLLREDVCTPWYRELLPEARWVRLPECGHVAQLDDPARVAELVRETTARAEAQSVVAMPPSTGSTAPVT